MVGVVDDTLREGMQTPGLMFSREERLRIAEGLLRAGVRRLIVSYPPAHLSECEAASAITILAGSMGQGFEVFGLGRALEKDVDRVAATGANIAVHLPFDGRYEEALKAVRYAKDVYPDRLVSVGLVDVGSYSVDGLRLPDTTGTLYPARYTEIVRSVKSVVGAEVSVHCHNDKGLAVANSLAGVEGGADMVECTVLGLGERNGIADLAVVAGALEAHGENVGIDLDKLRGVYDLVNGIVTQKLGFGLLLDNYPLFGGFLGVHTAGTHVGSEKFPGERYSVNVYTGRRMIRRILSAAGFRSISEDELSTLVAKVKDECALTGRALSYDRVLEMARQIVGS